MPWRTSSVSGSPERGASPPLSLERQADRLQAAVEVKARARSRSAGMRKVRAAAPSGCTPPPPSSPPGRRPLGAGGAGHRHHHLGAQPLRPAPAMARATSSLTTPSSSITLPVRRAGPSSGPRSRRRSIPRRRTRSRAPSEPLRHHPAVADSACPASSPAPHRGAAPSARWSPRHREHRGAQPRRTSASMGRGGRRFLQRAGPGGEAHLDFRRAGQEGHRRVRGGLEQVAEALADAGLRLPQQRTSRLPGPRTAACATRKAARGRRA